MIWLSNPLYVLSIFFLIIIGSEWLVNNTFCRGLGTALLVILLGAIAANLKIIPSASNAIGLYDGIFTYAAPLSIFFLLLEVNLKNIRKAGVPMLLMFALGTLGTVAGVFAGVWIMPMKEVMGEFYPAITGMFAGTYTGGSVNFNAVAIHYQVNKEGLLYAGSAAVDNIITTVWMLASIALPKILSKIKPVKPVSTNSSQESKDNNHSGEELLNVTHIGILAGMGLFTIWISGVLTDIFIKWGVNIPSILILTTVALILAQFPIINKLKGTRLMGFLSIYLFLVVIGAYCELSALQEIGRVGTTLLGFASILVIIHGLIQFGFGSLFYRDWELIAIASQANIGGSTTALALAKSFNRNDLLLPGILAGSLGNGVGTYIGFLIAGFLS
jgi:uncharacterized membrane protein